MGIEALFTKRIGVQERTWTEVTPRVVSPAGRNITDPGARAAQSLRRARDPELLEPRVQGLPHGSSWCADLAALNHRIQQARSWLSYTEASPISPLIEVERELAAKATLQRGGAMGYDIFPDGLGLKGGASIDEACTVLGDYLESRFPPTLPVWTPVPRGTNSGAPTYGTSDVDKLFHALLARQITDWSSAQAVYARHAGQLGAISTIHALAFSRTGPVRKPVAMYDWHNGQMAHVADATSVVPRRRAVFGVPAFINMALLGHANIVKYAVMRTPWTAHPNEFTIFEGLEYARQTVGRGALVFSDDITGFDQAVRRHHQESVARRIYARYWPGHTIDLWLGAQQMGVLSPPLDINARAFLYERPHGGVTTSGIITTSLDGTLINLARAITAVAVAQKTSVRAAFTALLDNRWSIRAWGDDTVMVVPPDFDVDRYTKASADIGYTTKAVEGATFLMKHYDFSRRAVYPLATRVFQQTVWNEQSGRSEEIELLGLYARTTGFVTNPYWSDMWSLISDDAPTLSKYGITSRAQIGLIISDPGFQQRLHHSIREHKSVVAQWIARAERGHSEDAALLSWLDALVGGGPAADAVIDLTHVQDLTLRDAERRSAQLASFLATPVDERGSVPSWISAMLSVAEDDTEENDTDEKGDKA